MENKQMVEEEPFVCPICLDASDDFIATLKPCNHRFHKECIRRWHTYSSDLKCPVCRVESHCSEITYTIGNAKKFISIDLKKGFDAKTVLDYREEESFSELSQIFDNALHLNSSLIVEGGSRISYCNICGEECSNRDRLCRSCDLHFHEGCLRSLAYEVGDPDSWPQCVECRAPVCQLEPYMHQVHHNHHHHLYADRTREAGSSNQDGSNEGHLDNCTTEEDLNRLREIKHKIQKHVREVLNTYYGTGIDGINIEKRHFTEVNRTVSRRLYKISKYEYLEGSINYDFEAKKNVHIELCRLGYSCV